MGLHVQKYGGTSVGSIERIFAVADRVLATQRAGHDVVVVVSAMAGETDRLLGLVKQVTDTPPAREQDVIVSTGEQVSVGLLSMAIQARGGKAVSLLGHQVKLYTDDAHSRARIKHIRPERVDEVLKKGAVAVIAGFQGIDEEGNITTLGRGGSDTSAVAMAAALGADACEIYTDVDGVYTTDPNVYAAARKLDRIAYDEMLELASLGAKVLQIRSVAFAKRHKVPLWVKSSFNDDPGTLVTGEDPSMEDQVVSGVAYDRKQAKIALRHVPDQPGIATKIFEPLSREGIVVDMIVQNVSLQDHTDVTFTVGRDDLRRATELVKEVAAGMGAGAVDTDENMAKVSIVGLGMRTHAGVAATMFGALASEGINIQMISTSEIKISAVIDEKYIELAVRTLHDAFQLHLPPTERA
ncbi:MAG: aspartate kinase [Deltaproteobacteria bacterium]|nr:aspartate kinase [Deltaproteobacteria bacterium]